MIKKREYSKQIINIIVLQRISHAGARNRMEMLEN